MNPITRPAAETIGFTILHTIGSLVQRISDVAMHIFETLKVLIRQVKESIASHFEPISFTPHSQSEVELGKLANSISKPPFQIPNIIRADIRNEVDPWLKNISRTSDFKNRPIRIQEQIYQYLRRAEEDSGFREVFLRTIHEAATSCGDRMCLSILHISLAEKQAVFASAGMNTPKKMKEFAEFLIRGPWAMGQLEEIARNKLASLRRPDQIEVFLAYPIGLKQRLRLQFDADSMLYAHASHVSKEDLLSAAEYIESQLTEPNAKNNILAGYEEWQKALQKYCPTEYEAIIQERNISAEMATHPEQYKIMQSRFLEKVAQLTSRVLQG